MSCWNAGAPSAAKPEPPGCGQVGLAHSQDRFHPFGPVRLGWRSRRREPFRRSRRTGQFVGVLRDNEQMSATPFSTGGGGTNFEQAFAATQLVALLRGQSVLLLGDDLRLGNVRFQAADVSDVDDLLLRSDPADGPTRTVAVALRHNPTIASSDDDFVALLATISNTFDKNREACRDGNWRIALVVAGPHTGARELAKLTDLARKRKTPDAQTFEKAVESSNNKLRQRFTWFSEALDKALGTSKFTGQAGAPHRARGVRRLQLREEFLTSHGDCPMWTCLGADSSGTAG